MNHVNATPIHVPADDKETRRRAAVAVGKAYVGNPLWWLCLLTFTCLGGLLLESAWQSHRAQLGASWIALPLGGALICVVLGVAFVPLANAVTIYRAADLYYLDTGQARAAMATKRDKRRDALPGDLQGHTFGASPSGTRTGRTLAEQVRDDVHARGGRLTGTALPGMAKNYIKHGMVDDGRVAGLLIRVASKPRPDNRDDASATDRQSLSDPTEGITS